MNRRGPGVRGAPLSPCLEQPPSETVLGVPRFLWGKETVNRQESTRAKLWEFPQDSGSHSDKDLENLGSRVRCCGTVTPWTVAPRLEGAGLQNGR